MKRSDILRVKKVLFLQFLFVIMILLIVLSSCDQLTGTKDDEPETLYVKFINDSTSTHTITNIQLRPMGKSGENGVVPDSVWSDNILKEGEKLAPGESKFFTLEIPNLHYSIYRLAVDNGTGMEVFLHDQANYDDASIFIPTITHWGSDERMVSVRLAYDSTLNLIYIGGYSDFAGIE